MAIMKLIFTSNFGSKSKNASGFVVITKRVFHVDKNSSSVRVCFEDKSLLPITGIKYKGLEFEIQKATVKIGALTCHPLENQYDMKTHLESLEQRTNDTIKSKSKRSSPNHYSFASTTTYKVQWFQFI